MRLAFVVFLMMLSCQAKAVVCTVKDQVINFGQAAYSSAVGAVTVPVTVTVNCPSGSYTLKPNSASLGYFTIPVYREGAANGNQYMYILNPGGQIMKPLTPATLITGTGNGTDQTYNLTAVLSGTSSPGNLTAFTKTGAFSITNFQLFAVVNGTTSFSPAQSLSGEIVGFCEISAVGSLAFGTFNSPTVQSIYNAVTTIQVRCDNNLAYVLKPDDNPSRWNLDSGKALDVSSPPRPADPAKLAMYIKTTGSSVWGQWGANSNFYNGVGNSTYQTYDVKGELTLSANWHGTIGSILKVSLLH
jgi:hypothetical protein